MVAGLILSAYTPLWNISGKYISVSPQVQPAGAIVVLASGVMADGSLGDESLRRAVYGFTLYKRGLPLGSCCQARRIGLMVEAAVRAKLAMEMGIPAAAILQETDVNTTRDEAQRIWELLGKGDTSSILLVTEVLHMRRAKMVFERAGFQVFPAPSDDYTASAASPEDRLKLMRRVLEEAGGLIYYRMAGYL